MIGCLCIHGFTGGPYEVEPLARYVQEQTNWLVELTILPGHGETLQLKGIMYDQWLAAAEADLQRVMKKCEIVYLVGFSMGGVIAAYLAAKYPVGKVVLLSPAFYYINPKQMLQEISGMIHAGLQRQLQEHPVFVRYKKKIVATPLTAAMEFRKLVSKVRPQLADIRVPILIVQGSLDEIVPVKSAQYVYTMVGSTKKKLLFLPSSRHQVCYEPDRHALFEAVVHFLQEDL
ncbi:Thermostable monoacylglycerol lipase [Anoxybacillus sp. P3H1B]|uniref:alpha/beta hydrolase n=1 Tax=Anoxybacillus sp. P3H1B TaxID=1769293 RepID=UPI0007962EB2|nr:alpha/beta fold hydrolase [Anoxybacillus sp. P3H1B]KXG09537.1 Thermostable monoacylglycerol lipase [Anoxybacillus sp. P3H1B]